MYAARIAPWVLAALAAAAAAAASAPAQARCTIASYGIINDNPHPLPRVILVPGRTDWDVRIQPVCPDEVGVLVTVCDWDVEPLARVEGLGEVRVRRRGEGRGEAVLDAVVYCVAGDGDRARDEDEDGPGTETGAATSGTTPKAEEDPELERDEK